MSKRIILAIIAVLSLTAQALNVQNTAGTLSTRITDPSVTTLTISGTMNAVDFYFITDYLHNLSTVDLSGVTVVACSLPTYRYWQQEFANDELPTGCFADKTLRSIKLPSSLRSIGKAAFASCNNLGRVTLPTALDSIGDYAFAGCTALRTVTLPASVVKVGRGAFMRCTSLISIQVEAPSRLSQVDATALMDCPALTIVDLGNALHTLGERSLAGTGVTQLDLSESDKLNELGDWAIVKTPVTEAKLPSSVKTVGKGAFLYDTELENITLGGHVSALSDYMLAGTSLNGEFDLSGVNSLGDYALWNVDGLSVVALPATVTWLGTRAMAGMTGLTELTSDATEVPALGEDVWQGVDQQQVQLTVPTEALSRYQEAEQWKEFLFYIAPPIWVKGDVNGDGEVNIADINTVVRIIQGYVADDDTMLRADVNEDGEINIADINLIIKIIMTGSADAPAVVDANDQLHLDDVAMRPGEVRTLEVTLDNAGSYSALQCDIILPPGLTLVDSKAISTHTGKTDSMDESTSRTVLYSSRRQHFAEDCAVFTITVQADASLASDSQIVLDRIVLADGDDTAWHPGMCTARVTNSTGIDDLNASVDRVWVEGRALCIDTRHDGTAQVAAINGTAQSLTVSTGVSRHELETGFYVVVLHGKSYKIAIK
jgi:hypothetical protein